MAFTVYDFEPACYNPLLGSPEYSLKVLGEGVDPRVLQKSRVCRVLTLNSNRPLETVPKSWSNLLYQISFLPTALDAWILDLLVVRVIATGSLLCQLTARQRKLQTQPVVNLCYGPLWK